MCGLFVLQFTPGSKPVSFCFHAKATYCVAIAIAFGLGENTFVIAKCDGICIYLFEIASSG
jgi:hypothetical protein